MKIAGRPLEILPTFMLRRSSTQVDDTDNPKCEAFPSRVKADNDECKRREKLTWIYSIWLQLAPPAMRPTYLRWENIASIDVQGKNTFSKLNTKIRNT